MNKCSLCREKLKEAVPECFERSLFGPVRPWSAPLNQRAARNDPRQLRAAIQEAARTEVSHYVMELDENARVIGGSCQTTVFIGASRLDVGAGWLRFRATARKK